MFQWCILNLLSIRGKNYTATETCALGSSNINMSKSLVSIVVQNIGYKIFVTNHRGMI